jgi:cellulose biosynthesis protein BcsQ
MAPSYPKGTFLAVSRVPPDSPGAGAAPLRAVVAVSCNKGGVGKTTLAANLAIYLRALREDQPVAVVGLDDQATLDRMFALGPPEPGSGNLKHGWAERSLDRVLRLGEYGIHWVPSPPDVTLLKTRAEDPGALRRILAATEWRGIFFLDTKSDLEALTRNAIHAADRVIVPISDWAALEEAGRTFALLERDRLPLDRARVVFTLVDRRSRLDGAEPLYHRLAEEVEKRGWPRYRTAISRSPRVEALNSGTNRPRSILHHARGTGVHAELRELAHELLWELEELDAARGRRPDPSVLWGRRVAPDPAPPGGREGPLAAGFVRRRQGA